MPVSTEDELGGKGVLTNRIESFQMVLSLRRRQLRQRAAISQDAAGFLMARWLVPGQTQH